MRLVVMRRCRRALTAEKEKLMARLSDLEGVEAREKVALRKLGEAREELKKRIKQVEKVTSQLGEIKERAKKDIKAAEASKW